MTWTNSALVIHIIKLIRITNDIGGQLIVFIALHVRGRLLAAPAP
jgi:hypothetical protein